MTQIRLVSWKPEDGARRAAELEAAGFTVDASPPEPGRLISQFKAAPSRVVLIDLDRLPSHGREVGVRFRQGKPTREIPLVYAGGLPEKVDRVRQELPDARYGAWEQIVPLLREALAAPPPAAPVVPPDHMARYSAAPLAGKLGLKPELKIALFGAPPGWERQFPEIDFATRQTASTDLVLWFVRGKAELEEQIAFFATGVPVWIIFPKQSGRLRSDCNQNDVRLAGLAYGLVDHKICSVDEDWSGMRFALSKHPGRVRGGAQAKR